MASDSQILALSTMFTEDVFAFYGGKARFGADGAGSAPAGLFVVHADARRVCRSRCGVAAVDFRRWRRSSAFAGLLRADAAAGRGAVLETRARSGGALASTLWTAIAVLTVAAIQQGIAVAAAGSAPCRSGRIRRHRHRDARRRHGAMVLGCLPVVPMTIMLGAADGDRGLAPARAARVPARRRWAAISGWCTIVSSDLHRRDLIDRRPLVVRPCRRA